MAHLELPELPGGDRPTHHLDPGPLVAGTSRAIGAGLGIGVMTLRRLAVGVVAGLVNRAQGFPFVREGLRRLLGRHVAGLFAAGHDAAVKAADLADLSSDELDRRLEGWRRSRGPRRWTSCASSRACGRAGTRWP